MTLDRNGAPLADHHGAIADRRPSAVPIALPSILAHRAQRVLGFLLRLIFVEQGHDLAQHRAHRAVAHVLGDRDDLDTIPRQLADVALELKLVAKEAREAMDEDHVERRRLGQCRIDHRLEGRPAVISRAAAGLDIILHHRPAPRCAIAFDLAALIGDRQVALGLLAGRDAEIGSGADDLRGGWWLLTYVGLRHVCYHSFLSCKR